MNMEQLKDQIARLDAEKSELKQEIQKLYNAQFDDWKELHELITACSECHEEHGQYHYNEYGDVDFSVSLDSLDLDAETLEYLSEYLFDHFVDEKNLTLSNSQGDCIVVNDRGDVFDGHECIIQKSEYQSELKRNHLIGSHMEKTGCFPGVFESDRNGYLTPISTIAPIEKYNPAKESEYVVGIVSEHTVDIDDMIPNDAIDLTYESWLADRRAELESEGKNEDDIDQILENEGYEYESDSTTYLIGDWIKVDGNYDIDKNGSYGFAATFNTDTNNISVEFSQTILTCHYTSPCYRMTDGRPCGDLDSHGSLHSMQAYSMPLEYWR